MENRDTEAFCSDLVSLKLHPPVVDTVLMTKVNFEETFEIYLFTDNELENNFSKLNEFLSFLKFNKVNLPYKFSYVGRGDSLIPEMTLNENIIMDFSPDSLTEAREFQFQEFLKQQPNRYLEKLYQKLAFLHESPNHSDAQMKRIALLIKSLIFEGQFIFLEEPEKDLDQECTDLFISALRDHISRSKQNVFIYSSQLDLWTPHVHQHVKREKDFSFSTEKVTRSWMWKKEREFFFKAMTKENSKNELLFNIPKKFSGKKSAA